MRSPHCRRLPSYRRGGDAGPLASARVSPKASHRPQRHRGGARSARVPAVLRSHGSFEMSLEGPGSLENWQASFTVGADLNERVEHHVPRPPQASSEAT